MFKRFFLVLLAGTLLGGIPVMAAALENETAGAIVREPVLTGEQAQAMVEVVMHEARESGHAVTVTVVDRSGQIRCCATITPEYTRSTPVTKKPIRRPPRSARRWP